ncbi:MAG: phosphonate metabolism protein/1,5-bisphosphokinase (PRPP-forming) PhnN [Rhodobacteraceae bacterium]|nr:phosphonate metabolism protein/1,5-bisphosphokinase (PRPP-forming) PhnN [Paracoccaceae bacterium]
MAGTLFLIVGPSGVGKDTLLDGARVALSGSEWFRFVRRVITRPEELGGEDYEAVSEDEFTRRRDAGAFLHHWSAHGLHYGIPADVLDDLGRGVNVILNTSRNELATFRGKWPDTAVIYITASPRVVEARLRGRGREDEAEIARRLARIVDQPAPADGAMELLNDASVDAGVATLVDLIAGRCRLRARETPLAVELGNRPLCLLNSGNVVAARLLQGTERVTLRRDGDEVVAELGWTDDSAIASPDRCALSRTALGPLSRMPGGPIEIERTPNPKSRAILQKKVRGGALSEAELTEIVGDLVAGRFSPTEIAGFLVSAAGNLTLEEVIALTKVRASYAHRQKWDAEIVVDKHSMGGIPGNRITPIVIPIVAACGLTMPKTSSRAITSAAGTADMMEVLARVDLTPAEMRKAVEESGACIAWNGRLTHSPVDEVMNAINRPLGLSSSLLDVSSIMSKKLAAGSTHVLIDLPVGPGAKTKTTAEAEALRALFEAVGEGVGLKTRVNLADGLRPVGRGVGPVLETIDVLKVLRGDPDAPADLRDKALAYAGMILEWKPGVKAGQGAALAEETLLSGRALEKLDAIVEAQGRLRHDPVPGRFTADIEAQQAGTATVFDIAAISAIARAAGAPRDKAAGVVILVQEGQMLEANTPVLRIHASSEAALADAQAVAAARPPLAMIGS